MAVPKILLYYSFKPIPDTDAVKLWQRDLCEGLGLRGRIIISKHGINGTVGGDINAVKTYLKKTKEYFGKMDAKWSDGTGFDSEGFSLDFPKLSVKARNELVAFGAPEELQVGARGVIGGGKHLKPAQVHELVAERGEEVVFFDGRNKFEAEIGRFKNAVVPDVETTHDFVSELESGKYDHLKDKPIVTYCTGGIRCEVLSSLMINRGFSEVYQIDGGIVRYGETFGDEGLWEGSLYVFDNRKTIDFSSEAKKIAKCVVCGTSTSWMNNCNDASCRAQLPSCEGCEDAVWCETHSVSETSVIPAKLSEAKSNA